jgi:hypothetical protein
MVCWAKIAAFEMSCKRKDTELDIVNLVERMTTKDGAPLSPMQ